LKEKSGPPNSKTNKQNNPGKRKTKGKDISGSYDSPRDGFLL